MKILPILICIVLFCLSCQTGNSTKAASKQTHWIEINRPSVGFMYLDSIPLHSVMKITDTLEMYNNFRAYLVGFKDSVPAIDKNKNIDNNKYYQYDMQHDWEAIDGGNTMKPVFYHSRATVHQSVTEGILVFETNGSHPDTLVYTDSHGSWGTQKFILKEE